MQKKKRKMSSNFWTEFFKFLKENLPSFLSGFFIGKDVGEGVKKKTAKEILELKYANEKLKNEKQVIEDNKSKSDSDVIKDAISKGRN